MKKPIKMRTPVLNQLQEASLKGTIVLFQPIWVRIFHWGFAFSLTGILLTGLILHKPANFLILHYGKVLITHLTFSWFAMGFVTLRIIDTLIRRDTSLIPKMDDLKRFPKFLAFYFFFRSTLPPCRKYNIGQMLVYSSWIILFIVASFLGFISYWEGEHLTWAWHWVGGYQIVRWCKFIATIYFLATIPLHIYLSLTEDLSRLQAMVTGYQRKPPKR